MNQQYTLSGRIETGELAELYRAQRVGAASVVIKLFHPRTSDVGYAQAVAETARTLSAVEHPGVAHVLEIGLVKHRLAVVREDTGRFNLGTALQRLTTKEVLLAPALALAWVIDLLDLVHQAHTAGVIHGALTPGNVMLTAEGRPAVCDFGALAALNASPALKKNFGSRGRNNYRAPELTVNEPVSIQSDLYSLGAITYELLTLREPKAGNAAAVSTRRELVPPPSRLDRRINSRLDPIVLRAIDAAPSRRFKTCADFAAQLRDFLSNNGGLPTKDSLERFTQELFPKEVNPDALGPVPFDDTFSLKEVDGADLEQTDERSMVLSARKGFSGGEVSSTAETSLSIPVFVDDAPPPASDRKITDEVPEPRGRDELSWDAPPSAAPIARKAGDVLPANAAAVQKRMRVAQDYEPSDRTEPTGAPIKPSADPDGRNRDIQEIAPPKPRAPATLVEIPSYAASPGESQPTDEKKVRDADGKLRRMITEERNLAATRARQGRMMMLAGGFLFIGFAIFVGAILARGQGIFGNGGAGTARKDPTPPPPRPILEPRPNPPPRPIQPPTPKVDCYDPVPKKGAAFLTVAVAAKSQIKVDLDGQRLCNLNSVAVAPGMHTVLAIDGKTGERRETKVRLEVGKNFKVDAFAGGK